MNERIREIALRFFEGTITAEEECELYGFLNGNPQGLAQMREWESCWKRDPCSAGRRARFARFAEAEDSAAASAAPSVAAYLGCGRGAGARLDARAASPSGRKARTAFYGRGAAGHAQPYLAARRYAGVAQCGIGVELRIEFQRNLARGLPLGRTKPISRWRAMRHCRSVSKRAVVRSPFSARSSTSRPMPKIPP